MDIQVKTPESVPTDEEKKGEVDVGPNQLVQSEPWTDDSELLHLPSILPKLSCVILARIID
jgi:hypothetical protein